MSYAQYDFHHFTGEAQALIRTHLHAVVEICELGMRGAETADRYEHNLLKFSKKIDTEYPYWDLHVRHGFRGTSFERTAGFTIAILDGGFPERSGQPTEISHTFRMDSSSIAQDPATCKRQLALIAAAVVTGERASAELDKLNLALNTLKSKGKLIDEDKVRVDSELSKRRHLLVSSCDDSHARNYFEKVLMPIFRKSRCISDTIALKVPSGKPRKWLQALEGFVYTIHVRGKESKITPAKKALAYMEQAIADEKAKAARKAERKAAKAS